MWITTQMRDVFGSPYYRTRPFEAVKFGYAKWLLSRFRFHDPVAYLHDLGINPASALEGFDRWRPLLRDVIQSLKAAGGQQGGISIEDGTVLYGLTRALRPRTVVETGIAAGVSTSFFSAALIENGLGRLYSIDLADEAVKDTDLADGARYEWVKRGVGWAIPQELRDGMAGRHTVIIQDVRVALPKLLESLDTVDIFFHDDLHTPDHMTWEYRLLWPRLSAGGLIVSDDVNYGWVRFCEEQRLAPSGFRNIQRLAVVRKNPVSLAAGA